MNHTHDHAPRRRTSTLPASPLPASPLGAGLGARLVVAAAATGLLWLAVFWALN
ncbi:MAG: hypothetical protein Q7J47_21245 [Azoarcus sp.]|nr:hypothetical protein [Azoarcus sp.]